jgi:fkbH domain
MNLLTYPFDVAMLRKKQKAIRRELLEQDVVLLEKRIAILGGSTTNMFRDFLELFLLDAGVKPIFYESEYAQYYEEAVFQNDALSAFAPDIIFVFTTSVNLKEQPSVFETKEEAEARINREYARYQSIWDGLAARYHAVIIQNNFEMPAYLPLGSLDAVLWSGWRNTIESLNAQIAAYALTHAGMYVHDVHYLASVLGMEQWFDLSQYSAYKLAVRYESMPFVALHAANVVKAVLGKTKKCLVLDLDNTLWGGIIGDDGMEGIQIGKETPEAEAYTAFQRYLLTLKERGVLLAVCSKNEEVVAKSGFSHPDTVLQLDDFVAFQANWESKDQNIRAIARQLNIGLDSLVFLDDNPVERAIVRQGVPEVAVPEVTGGDVVSYIRALERNGYFEPIAISEDDRKRSEAYRENKKRVELEASLDSYEDFLQSLDMRAEIASFQPIYYDRIAQLTNKSNQFNLTTFRYTRADIERMAKDSHYITLYGRLQDRFGDNGLVSVIIAEKEGSDVHIRLWLMSCRVLKRGMEEAMMDVLLARTRLAGGKKLIGYYYPTAKNGMVRDFYGLHGFSLLEDVAGAMVWVYDLAAKDTSPVQRHFIMVKEAEVD